MYLTHIRTLVWKALSEAFDREYPDGRFRALHVSREYPLKQDQYPALWVDFEPQGDVRNIGIGHREAVVGEQYREHQRWTYAGQITMTVITFTSLERDFFVDEVIKVCAHSNESAARSDFRRIIEDNDYIACQPNWDKVGMRGAAVSRGTPWGTDDLLYEMTLSLDAQGEFVSDGWTQTLIPISEVQITAYRHGEPDPTTGGGWV